MKRKESRRDYLQRILGLKRETNSNEERRAFAAGFINAGVFFGQFAFAPLLQSIIGAFDWVAAILSMAVTALLTIPFASSLWC